MESTRDRLPDSPPCAPGCAFCVPQGEFPAGPTIRKKKPSASPHGRDFEHEDEHVHEHEEQRVSQQPLD